jgi:GT2 family glycosyltransferase
LGKKEGEIHLKPFSVLIITYNSQNDIPRLLDDLHQLTPPPDGGITVIDNASQDGTISAITSGFPEVRLIANPQNVGFIKAVNQGVEISKGEYVFLLNPDIRVTDPWFYPAMLACIEDSLQIAAVGPLQFKRTGGRLRLNLSWSFMNPRAIWLNLFYALRGKIPYQTPFRTPFLNAGCLLLRRAAFIQVGKLNEKYFMYGEEPDLFLKFKRHGYECRLHPGVGVIHQRENSLNTLPTSVRQRIRLQAIYNITHALLNGYYKNFVSALRRSKWGQTS